MSSLESAVRTLNVWLENLSFILCLGFLVTGVALLLSSLVDWFQPLKESSREIDRIYQVYSKRLNISIPSEGCDPENDPRSLQCVYQKSSAAMALNAVSARPTVLKNLSGAFCKERIEADKKSKEVSRLIFRGVDFSASAKDFFQNAKVRNRVTRRIFKRCASNESPSPKSLSIVHRAMNRSQSKTQQRQELENMLLVGCTVVCATAHLD